MRASLARTFDKVNYTAVAHFRQEEALIDAGVATPTFRPEGEWGPGTGACGTATPSAPERYSDGSHFS
ncbi:hypothetical protein COCCU_09285 [Corynebacterium occultum]|uniref:Uncharacterized protein n=1 Tax=Corynebacterium occultum TaxID=2675219 RepID=A0A6B8W5E3_9CORY|nr:hypothetical protein [Corynebacterium occultum]QGU07781.1 hypothetical protein COCCU_09285 [Corynebacterium occultum]